MEGVTPEQLLETTDLITVGVEGDEVRRRLHGTKTTFNRVFEIHVDAAAAVSRDPKTQAGEFRILGRPSSLEALTAAVRSAVAVAGEVPVTVFSVADLLSLPHAIGQTAVALKEAGASAIVQLPVDSVDAPVEVAREVQAAGLPILVVSIQDLDDERRLEICENVRALQAAVGGFKAFAPLPRTLSVTKPTTGYDDVKMVALSRVVVQNIESIQVDWPLYGPKLAQVALIVGANDVDGIAGRDPGILGTRRSPVEEIRGNIKAASLGAVERDALFRENSKLQIPNSKTSI